MKGVLAFVVLVIAVNLAVRFVPWPAIDLPELPEWLHWALRIKNVLIGALIVFVVAGGVLGDRRRRRDSPRSPQP